MERCSRRRQFGIPVLYGRGSVAVRADWGGGRVAAALPLGGESCGAIGSSRPTAGYESRRVGDGVYVARSDLKSISVKILNMYQ